MKKLKEEGHKMLIFSMSKAMLNLLERMINGKTEYKKNYKYLRIDGDTEIDTREGICNKFNSDKSIFCCLLTTKVGGFGLNLTGADRAVILDPDWNPANDNQAVDRCYRIGQSRDCIVYRLVSIGGIEEKMYRRQVYKKGMTIQTLERDCNQLGEEGKQDDGKTDAKAFEKYFSNSDLFDLFQYKDESEGCETLQLILEKDDFQYEKTPTNERHIEEFLYGVENIVHGITLNSNLYTAEAGDANS